VSSPVFVATFVDGTTTRMTTYAEYDGEMNLMRGIILARYAYRSRTGKTAPALMKAKFETSEGETLQTYSSKELERP
jgi:hypothetical protein